MSEIKPYLLSKFFRDRLILVSALVAFLTHIILWILLVSKFGYSHEPVPLHFNVVYGIDFVGSATRIYEIPILGLIVLISNSVVAKIIYEREKLFSYFLSVAAAGVQIILLVAAVSLIRVS